MKRAAEEKKIARREHRKHMRQIHGWPKLPVTCPCDLQENRFRKKDAFDCGHARCGTCHRDKLCGHEKTKQEIDAELATEEQLADMAELNKRTSRSK